MGTVVVAVLVVVVLVVEVSVALVEVDVGQGYGSPLTEQGAVAGAGVPLGFVIVGDEVVVGPPCRVVEVWWRLRAATLSTSGWGTPPCRRCRLEAQGHERREANGQERGHEYRHGLIHTLPFARY